MFTLLIATALAATKFPGGSPNDFASLLAGAAKQNVVVEQGEGQVIRACEFDPSDLTELARAIRNQTQMAIMPGSDLVLTDGLLARKLVESPSFDIERSDVLTDAAALPARPSSQDPRFAFQPLNMGKKALPAGAVQKGRVTFSTEKSDGLDLGSLNGQMSKPVTVHWILKDAVVCCQVAGLSEDDFLKWVAKSAGGRLISTAKDYTLDIDPIEIRRRAINTISRQVSVGNVAVAEQVKAFRIAALNSLNAAQIKAALATDGAETKIVLNQQNPMSRSALAYIQTMARNQAQQNGNQRRGRGNANANELRQMDNTRPAYLVIDSRFNAFVEIPIRSNRGSGGTVRF